MKPQAYAISLSLEAIVAGIGRHLKRLREAERQHTFGEARPHVVAEIADKAPRIRACGMNSDDLILV
jgi:hypothetical protein